MAILKDLIVNGAARIAGKIYSSGGFIGNLTGNVTGNVVGNVTGNVVGNVVGNVTGSVNGNVSGSASGIRESTSSAVTKAPAYHASYVITAAVKLTLSTSGVPIGTIVHVSSTVTNATCTFPNTGGSSITTTFVAAGTISLVRAGSGFAYLNQNAMWN